jgi:ADP-ribose pyrophosphatase
MGFLAKGGTFDGSRAESTDSAVAPFRGQIERVAVPDPTLISVCPVWRSSRFTLEEESWDTTDGRVVRPVIHHPGAVVILAEPEPGRMLLVRQWRYPVRRWTLEVPAGTRVPGEAPETTAARELAEEAGYAADRLSEVTRFFPALGVSDEEMIVYRAEGLHPAAGQRDHGELVARHVVARTDLAGLVASGVICDGKTLLALAMWGVPLVSAP